MEGYRSKYLSGGSAASGAPPSETFSRINPDTKFLDGEQVEGVHLVDDFDLVRQLQVRLGKFIPNGKGDFFSAMWPVSLSTDNVHLLASESYVVAPKPTGPRFFLYVDPEGSIFLENMTQNIFRVDEDHAIKMESFDGRPITDTVLDGIITREKLDGAGASCEGSSQDDGPTRQLTFVICDAIRCNGKDLTNSSILQRIAYVRGEIMKPRKFATQNRNRSDDEKEAFDLDVVEYNEAYQTENYLSREFVERYKYPYRSFVFFPRKKLYRSFTNEDSFQWQEGDLQECSFRLKIPKGVKEPKKAQLHVGGPYRQEILYAEITLTEEIKKLDGCIIDCRYFDHEWIFMKQRLDRNHPNGRRAVQGKRAALEKAVSRELLLTNLEQSKGLN